MLTSGELLRTLTQGPGPALLRQRHNALPAIAAAQGLQSRSEGHQVGPAGGCWWLASGPGPENGGFKDVFEEPRATNNDRFNEQLVFMLVKK